MPDHPEPIFQLYEITPVELDKFEIVNVLEPVLPHGIDNVE